MQNHNAGLAKIKPRAHRAKSQTAQPKAPHPVDQHVGQQLATVRVQTDITQGQLARSIGISFQQLQKYENARNRVSASMLFEISKCLGVPVSRFFEGLPGNERAKGPLPTLPVDERIVFIASAEGRRLMEGLMRLQPRSRGKISTLIAALAEEVTSPADEGPRVLPPT